jgi:hypothetical protein
MIPLAMALPGTGSIYVQVQYAVAWLSCSYTICLTKPLKRCHHTQLKRPLSLNASATATRNI